MRKILLFGCLIASLLLSTNVGFCQTSQAPITSSAPSKQIPTFETINKLLQDIKQQKIDLQTKIQILGESNHPNIDALLTSLEITKQLELVLTNQSNLLGLLKEAYQNEPSTEPKSIPQKTSYSIDELDAITQQLSEENTRLEALKRESESSQASLSEAKSNFETKEKERRLFKEQAEKNPQDKVLASQLLKAQLASQLESENLNLFTLKKELSDQKIKKAEHKISLITEDKILINGKTHFTQNDLNSKLAALDQDEDSLKDQIQKTKTDLAKLEHLWNTFNADQQNNNILLHIDLEATQNKLEILNFHLVSKLEKRKLWQMRFKYFNQDLSTPELEAEKESLKQIFKRFDRMKRFISDLNFQQQQQSWHFQEQLQNLKTHETNQKKLLDQQLEILKNAGEFYSKNLLILDNDRRFVSLINAELKELLNHVSFTDYIKRSWSWIQSIWNHELFIIDDKPLTLEKLFIALTVFLLGLYFSKYLSRSLMGRLVSRMKIHHGARSALQALTYYLLILFFSFLALNMASIPLTVFTLVGGAFAIGLGFGSQNLINNFMSGLILLAERPITTGDTIEIDGIGGKVEKIGARCTNIKTFNNIDILVPNSNFLEKNVINWTLLDDQVRTTIKVGIAYGSDIQLAKKCLLEVAKESKKVIQHLDTIVMLNDFGDNAMSLELLVWFHMNSMLEKRMIESDLRISIEQKFKENNIIIAYPQRDVHLHTPESIQVKINQ